MADQQQVEISVFLTREEIAALGAFSQAFAEATADASDDHLILKTRPLLASVRRKCYAALTEQTGEKVRYV